MTIEEKRKKIAEACGWKREIIQTVVFYRKGNELRAAYELPDYFKDLNACHEMEKVMDKLDRSAPTTEESGLPMYRLKYGRRLIEMTTFSIPYDATSTQRSDAFGLTLGLWKEGE